MFILRAKPIFILEPFYFFASCFRWIKNLYCRRTLRVIDSLEDDPATTLANTVENVIDSKYCFKLLWLFHTCA